MACAGRLTWRNWPLTASVLVRVRVMASSHGFNESMTGIVAARSTPPRPSGRLCGSGCPSK
eukprot:365861-Chlamydomonas_euryale.AAC.34